MELQLIGHEDRYAVEQLQMALFSTRTDARAVSALHRGKKWLTAVTTITAGAVTTKGIRRCKAAEETVRLRRQILQQSYYTAALPHLPAKPAWGALAGVRPTKISTKHLLEGGSPNSAKKLLEKTYYVTPERSSLAVDCSVATVSAVNKLRKEDISLYIGIPFCPTRCTYCSFVSRTVGKRTQLLQPYLEALLREITHTAALMKENNKCLRTLYIGGGTPTTLSAQQLEQLLTAVNTHFDLSQCLEFTVEAGRPDTLDEEKLRLLRRLGADRISINPQTLEDDVLRACGRPHNAEDVLRCFDLARQAGFENINMDLIAGLPRDSFDGFCRSLNTVVQLQPENITVHTLALKKGADLFERRQMLPALEEVKKMVDYANKTLSQSGYMPYYLYRQKYMSGSFENVGWSRNGHDCLYNIYMMEEVHSILSLGGGGMTKVNYPDGSLERFHNPKFPEQYLEQLEDVLQQKEEIIRLL